MRSVTGISDGCLSAYAVITESKGLAVKVGHKLLFVPGMGVVETRLLRRCWHILTSQSVH